MLKKIARKHPYWFQNRKRWRKLAGGVWEKWIIDAPGCHFNSWYHMEETTREREIMGKSYYSFQIIGDDYYMDCRPAPHCRGTPTIEDYRVFPFIESKIGEFREGFDPLGGYRFHKVSDGRSEWMYDLDRDTIGNIYCKIGVLVWDDNRWIFIPGCELEGSNNIDGRYWDGVEEWLIKTENAHKVLIKKPKRYEF